MASITHVCVFAQTNPAVTASNSTVYYTSESGATSCTFDSVLPSASLLQGVVARLAPPALLVLKGAKKTDTTVDAWKTVVNTLWKEFSTEGKTAVSVSVKAVHDRGVTDVISNREVTKGENEAKRYLSERDLPMLLRAIFGFLDRGPGSAHLIVEFERGNRPAFVTGQNGGAVSVVGLACPEGVAGRDVQLFELSLAELARGVTHIPYPFNPLISHLTRTILGDKLLVTLLPSPSPAQSLWLIESTGQMNSSLLTLKPGSRRLAHLHLSTQMKAVEKVLNDSADDQDRKVVRRLASANADLSSLYRNLVKPSACPSPWLRPPTGSISRETRKRSVLWIPKEVEMDLGECLFGKAGGRRRAAVRRR